jgi:SAM-dependent methyltransferase
MADGGKARATTQAQRADRHVLYERAVQAVDVECEFIVDTFRKLRGRVPRVLREDFCGTAAISCYWTGLGPRYRATGVDLDPDVLAWASARRLPALTPARRRRVTLVQGNVLDVRGDGVGGGPVDVVGAFNFSYWVFKTRPLLRQYFRAVRESLADDGVFFLDAFGGYDAYRELRESTPHRGFTYVWDQASYSPVTGDIRCHIHFRFPDGSRLQEAFTYDWRLWSLPEIAELLAEAGFRRTAVYWEGTAADGRGSGEFSVVTRGDADAGWVAYVVAEP